MEKIEAGLLRAAIRRAGLSIEAFLRLIGR